MSDDLTELLGFAEQLADAVRPIVAPLFRAELEVESKAAGGPAGQPVTRADRDAEAAMRAMIGETYPDHGILGEELGHKNPDADLCWVLDPIDGTRAFIAGLPLFGTLIALTRGGEPLIGIIDQPISHERYTGGPAGSFFNGRPLRTRRCPRLAEAVHAITDHRMMQSAAQKVVLERIMHDVQITQFGGNCLSYASLAAGQIDIVTEADLKPWDVAALVPVITGAGGVITAWDGGPALGASAVVACGDPALHADILPLLKGAA